MVWFFWLFVAVAITGYMHLIGDREAFKACRAITILFVVASAALAFMNYIDHGNILR